MRRLPPLGAIQAFVSAARLGSVRAAADALALSSPALTRRIQALEQIVGSALFERRHNSFELNPVGERLLGDIAPHLDALCEAIDRASGASTAMRIKVAVPSLFASQRLVPALPSLLARHPDLQVEFDTGPNRLARLSEGIDAAIVIASGVDPKYHSQIVDTGRIVAIGSSDPGHRLGVVTPADLATVQVLLHRDMPSAFEAWANAIGQPDLKPASVALFDSGQLVLDAAAQGIGVAFMLDRHLAASNGGKLVQLFGESASSPYAYWFACARSALTRPPVIAFRDWLTDTVALPARADDATALDARGSVSGFAVAG